jgi:signal transduction histidine kinase
VDARAVVKDRSPRGNRWELLTGWTALFVGLGEPGGLPRWPRWFHRYGQGVLAVAAFLLALIGQAGAGRWLVPQLVAVGGVAPLALVAWRPLVAWRVASLAALAAWFFPTPHDAAWPAAPGATFVMIVVLFAVGATQPSPVVAWVWAATVLLAVAEANPNNNHGMLVLFITILMVAGDQMRRRARAQRALRHQEERGAVLAERTRIARELHDVVAHHMSMVAVRAETAPYRLGGLPEPVIGEFSEISATARESLVEMRRVLGVLRSEDQAIAFAPQPGLAEITELVERARAAGAAVAFDPPGGGLGATPTVELTAYRIVQEALSNVVRHAPGVPAWVALVRSAEDLTVVVGNEPPGRPVPDNSSGHGLLGMRERAAAVGGQLSAGRTVDGGFEVRAVLPLSGGTD